MTNCKHKEALEALQTQIHQHIELRLEHGYVTANTPEIEAAISALQALQAASWQPIEDWDNDKTFGNYVLVAWENGLVEEMHWASVREYKKPKHHAGRSLKYFRRMPAAPVDGGG